MSGSPNSGVPPVRLREAAAAIQYAAKTTQHAMMKLRASMPHY